jgi:hypothetical protein
MNADITRSAVISVCRNYRYELWRKWSDAPCCVFVGLNPSTADEIADDATIRKCIRYARLWGYGGLGMVNLFAWRATNPKEMMAVRDPVGPENDDTICRIAASAGIMIAVWGNRGSFNQRDKAVKLMLPRLYCLHKTKSGAPGHFTLNRTLSPFHSFHRGPSRWVGPLMVDSAAADC